MLDDQPQLDRPPHRICTGANAQLGEDRRDVMVDRLLGEEQALGNLSIPQPSRHQRQDLELTRCEPGGVFQSRRAWPAGQPTGPALP